MTQSKISHTYGDSCQKCRPGPSPGGSDTATRGGPGNLNSPCPLVGSLMRQVCDRSESAGVQKRWGRPSDPAPPTGGHPPWAALLPARAWAAPKEGTPPPNIVTSMGCFSGVPAPEVVWGPCSHV